MSGRTRHGLPEHYPRSVTEDAFSSPEMSYDVRQITSIPGTSSIHLARSVFPGAWTQIPDSLKVSRCQDNGTACTFRGTEPPCHLEDVLYQHGDLFTMLAQFKVNLASRLF